jgi:pimeloyl-ACP methyl ester carboxylesterase
MEPTVMDPHSARPDGAVMSEASAASVQGTLRRRSQFDSVELAFNRYRAAPAFADWSHDALATYLQHGFETLPDGRVQLKCRPEIEAAMLRSIFEAMEQVYAGDDRGNPFASLAGIQCPVCVAAAEKSWPIYKEMAARAVALIPGASQWAFAGVGHCVAQENPDLLLQALEAFEKRRA